MEDVPLLIFFLLLSGFFSGAEIAIFSLSPERIHAARLRAKSTSRKKRLAQLDSLVQRPHQLLVTILLGNNVVNIAASSLATVMAFDLSRELGFEEATGGVVGIVTGIMTLLVLIFGEITPKALAQKHALTFSLVASPILQILRILLYPAVWPLSKFVIRVVKPEDQTKSHALSEDEIKAALELSERGGEIEHGEKELLEKVLEFDEHTVEDIMTPRSKIFGLDAHMKVNDAIKEISKQKWSRIPVFEGSLDNIQGLLTVHMLISHIANPKSKSRIIGKLPLQDPIKIPPTMKIDTLLTTFQAKNTSHMALVYDEYGGLVGLITLEDILEEVFGEIYDETDTESAQIRRISKNRYSCNSNVELEHIETYLTEKILKKPPMHFPWDREDENNTLAYFLLEQLERFPAQGEKIHVQNEEIAFEFTIHKVEDQSIKVVHFTVAPMKGN